LVTARFFLYLCRSGAHPDATDKDGFTPLLLAASEGQSDAVAALMRHGASLAVMDKNEKTAIYWAAQVGDAESIKHLLSHRLGVAMIDRSDRNDNSPLHVAAAMGFLDVVKLLLDNGSKIDNRNDDEATPLILAVKFGRTR
jgi:ankyrin repeat protein